MNTEDCTKIFVSLSEFSSIRIGERGTVYFPGSAHELIQIRGDLPCIGLGSNVLFRPTTKEIVCTRRLCAIQLISSNKVKCECGVPNSYFLEFLIAHRLGVMEYIASIPGTIGGAVFMNAGRGKKHDQWVGQNVVEVEFFDGRRMRRLTGRECEFGHRRSVFQRNPNWTITITTFSLKDQDPIQTSRLIKERREMALRAQDRNAPNLGTVYSGGFNHEKEFLGLRSGGVAFSAKTPNWILNVGHGTFHDCIHLLEEVSRRHDTPPELEIRIL